MLLCVGAEGGGKTLLLHRLLADHKTALNPMHVCSSTTSSNSTATINNTVPTTGVNITRLQKPSGDKNKPNPELTVRELGELYPDS